MMDLIVFSVGTNKYAVDIENVQRIIQSTELTGIPNAHEYVDGMMSYEDKVIKVLNFRKLITLDTYDSELRTLFVRLKGTHKEWIDALKASLETGVDFKETLNPHACELGKWIDGFTAYDDSVVVVLNELLDYHKQLHVLGANALDIYKKDQQEALTFFNKDVLSAYSSTMSALDTFVQDLDLVANSLQKLIIYDNKGEIFAVKVDTIEDIAHVEESEFINTSEDHSVNEYLELDGVLDLDGVLINVIKTIKLAS